MKQQWDDFRAAGAFLSIFPLAGSVAIDDQRLVRSMGLFPAVGLMFGLVLVVCDGLLGGLLPRPVLDAVLLLVLIVMTGALHLDGFADTLDGLAGGRERERCLRIMKDSRVGAIGVVGLVILILLKYLSLAHLPLAEKAAALILMPTAGRWSLVFLARWASYVRPEGGTGSVFVERVGDREFLLASLTLLLAALVLFSFQGLLLALLLLLFAVLLLYYFKRRLGGVTGDLLGAACESVEVFSLLILLAIY